MLRFSWVSVWKLCYYVLVIRHCAGFVRPGYLGSCLSPLRGVGENNKQIVLTTENYSAPICDTIQTEDGHQEHIALIHLLTEQAINNRGIELGLLAIEKLNELCQHRIPFNFGEEKSKPNGHEKRNGEVIQPFPQLLPWHVSQQIVLHVKSMVANGFISTNPDSVDGLPSFHLNLVSNGKAIASVQDLNGNDDDSFENGIVKLRHLIEPYIYDILLPTAREAFNTTDLYVSDIFLRRYGKNILNEESRNGISAHYDVFSKATCVIALDDVGADGRNGLYTTARSDDDNDETVKSSNHVALRRFFPLSCGDAVFHSWDVLHGVDVEPGLDRTSLIVWFTSSACLEHTEDVNPLWPGKAIQSDFKAPWILDRNGYESDGISQFVLASAIESTSSSLSTYDETSNEQSTYAMSTNAMHLSPFVKSKGPRSTTPFELYLESAKLRNTLALTRLGSFFCENDDNIPAGQVNQAWGVLTACFPSANSNSLRSIFTVGDTDPLDNEHGCYEASTIGKFFYYEAAIRGDPMAQMKLANEVMFDIDRVNNINDDDVREDSTLLATTLFALAGQQFLLGNNDPTHYSIDALARIVLKEIQEKNIQHNEEFESSPIIQTATIVLSNVS